MTKFYHLCINVRGALLHWNKDQWKGCFKHDDGRVMTDLEARSALMDELALGHKVIPTSDDCEGFDYERGCPGHETVRRATNETPEAQQSGEEPQNKKG